jgi:hypothetical protein
VGQLHGATHLRARCIKVVTFLLVAVQLSACTGGPSPPGVLTQANIPGYLGVKFNPSQTASLAGQTITPPCKTHNVTVFTVPGQKDYEPTLGLVHAPQVTSVSVACSNASEQGKTYRTMSNALASLYGTGSPVSGVGDDAKLFNVGRVEPRAGGSRLYSRGYGSPAHSYLVVWRANDQIDAVTISGPSEDERITPALAELLARRAAARS